MNLCHANFGNPKYPRDLPQRREQFLACLAKYDSLRDLKAQEAIANEPKPVHVPRERKPVSVMDEGGVLRTPPFGWDPERAVAVVTFEGLVGATRALTQLFSYEAPFLLALLGPAIAAGSWQISEINQYAGQNLWMIVYQPVGFLVAIVGLMGKLELPPFDAPEAETEIVKGALTEYSGRGLALFQLAKAVELVVGLTLIAAFYLGGIGNPIEFLLKTLAILLVLAGLQSLFARFRIEQTAKWWRYASLLLLAQWLIIALLGGKTL